MTATVVSLARYRAHKRRENVGSAATPSGLRPGDRVRVAASSNVGYVQAIIGPGYLQVMLTGGIIRRLRAAELVPAPLPFRGEG
jgi:hypothetical protein